jgi:hypothetical protein
MSRRSPALDAFLLRADSARRRSDLPVLLCIDVEPDKHLVDRRDPGRWPGFERFVQKVPRLRERLSEITGHPAAFTWTLRMDPQIELTWGSATWVADFYGDALESISADGDELGLHPHTWRWDEAAGSWLTEYEDEAWVRHCIEMSLDAYESSFGHPCGAHRTGEHFLTAAMFRILGERGVRADLTIEPGRPPEDPPYGEANRGRLPDYRGLPTSPYRSSPGRFPHPDPTSAADPLLIPLFSPPMPPLRRRPLHASSRRFAPRLALGLLRPPPALAIAVRSDAGTSAWETVESNLEHLARHRGVRFMTVSDAVPDLADGLGPRASGTAV